MTLPPMQQQSRWRSSLTAGKFIQAARPISLRELFGRLRRRAIRTTMIFLERSCSQRSACRVLSLNLMLPAPLSVLLICSPHPGTGHGSAPLSAGWSLGRGKDSSGRMGEIQRHADPKSATGAVRCPFLVECRDTRISDRPDLAQCTHGCFRCQRLPGTIRGRHPLQEVGDCQVWCDLRPRRMGYERFHFPHYRRNRGSVGPNRRAECFA